MPQKPISRAEAERRIEAVNRAIIAGHSNLHRACAAASEIVGISPITLRSSLPIIKAQHDLEPMAFPAPLDIRAPKKAVGLTFPVFPSDDIPTEHILDHLERQYTQDAIATAARKWFTIKADENLPIAINWFGDPHLGSPGCNLSLLRRDVGIVAKTPGMYGGNIGDTIDGWTGRLIRLYADSDVSKKTERQLARWFLTESGIRWMIWLHGNHDSFSPEFVAYMEEIGSCMVPMVEWRSQFIVAFPNGQEFRIDAAHDHKGHSQWSELHGQERASIMEEPADLYIAGHRHNWAYKVKEMIDGRVVSLARCRGYKFLDGYAVRWQFAQQQQGASIVTILDPLATCPTERVKVFADTVAGAEYLTYLRESRKTQVQQNKRLECVRQLGRLMVRAKFRHGC